MKATISTRKTLAIVLTAIALTAIVTYVFAASSTIPFTISGGNYPGAPSYTIWCEGSNYFAKNASGVVEFSGTNATQVIQSAADALPNGGRIFLTDAEYELHGSLYLGRRICLEGESKIHTILSIDQNLPIIVIPDVKDGLDVHSVIVRNLRLNVKYDSYDGAGIRMDGDNAYCRFEDLWIEKTVGGKSGYGIYIRIRSGSTYQTHNCFDHIYIYNFDIGLYLVATVTDAWINANSFSDITVRTANRAVYLNTDQSSPKGINHNHFINVAFQADATTNGFLDLGSSGALDHNIFIGCKLFDAPDGTYYISLGNGATNTIVIGGNLNDYTAIGTTTNLIAFGAGYQNTGTATISSGTSVTFTHGLAGTPDVVLVGWQDTGYGTWSWSANSTHITITVTNSGTYDFSWYAEYKP